MSNMPDHPSKIADLIYLHRILTGVRDQLEADQKVIGSPMVMHKISTELDVVNGDLKMLNNIPLDLPAQETAYHLRAIWLKWAQPTQMNR